MIWRFETNEYDLEQEYWDSLEDDRECPIPHGDEDYEPDEELPYFSESDYEVYDDGSDCIIEIDHSQDEIRGPF